ncbi:uncharacterized protein [Oscarella lobularis]|uniref:uncharacterized protein n=1 Tax=Oscarella lobularis TaxID=121494 RepID=UPI003313EE26
MQRSFDNFSNGTSLNFSNEFSFDSSAQPDMTPERVFNISVAAFTILLCGFLFVLQILAKQYNSFSYMLMLNLIITDLFGGVSIVTSATFITQKLTYTSSYNAGCKVAWFLYLFTTGWSGWAVLFVTFDRYYAIANSLKKYSRKKAILCLCLSGLVVFAFPLLIVAGWSELEAGLVKLPYQKIGICRLLGRNGRSKYLLTFSATYYSVTFYLPKALTVIFLILLLAIAWKVSKRANERRRLNSRPNVENSATLSLLRSRGFKFIVAIVICKIVCVLPLQIFNLGFLAGAFDFHIPAYRSTKILYSANFVINTVLYVFWLKDTNALARLKCKCMDNFRGRGGAETTSNNKQLKRDVSDTKV